MLNTVQELLLLHFSINNESDLYFLFSQQRPQHSSTLNTSELHNRNNTCTYLFRSRSSIFCRSFCSRRHTSDSPNRRRRHNNMLQRRALACTLSSPLVGPSIRLHRSGPVFRHTGIQRGRCDPLDTVHKNRTRCA